MNEFEKILIEADNNSNDDFYLGVLWQQIIENRKDFKTYQLLFAREHFYHLAEQLSIKRGCEVKEIAFNIFNYNEQHLFRPS
jgi:hypothetical protein